jgi:Uma2 family endonuclease
MPALRATSTPQMEKSIPARATVAAMNVALRKPWTQEQFFSWAEAQETRYEFDGIQPVAMTGGNAGHSRVFGNLLTALKIRLRGGPCEPLGPDAGVETVNDAIRYPDALVTCSKFENAERTIPGVIVVFEVLSPTSGRIDRIDKVREYAAVPTIRRYVILESTNVGLTVMERNTADQVWQTTVLTNDDILRMPEIGIEIPIAEIYEGINFPDQDEAPG